MAIDDEPTRTDPPSSVSGSAVRVRMHSPGHRRVWFVRIACFVAVALFATTSAMLYFGWLDEKEPVGVIAVEGSAAYADATVIVSGAGLAAPLSRTFAEGTDYRLRFHVAPGTYRVQIFRGKTALYSNDHATVERQPLEIVPFSGRAPSTSPASTSASQPA